MTIGLGCKTGQKVLLITWETHASIDIFLLYIISVVIGKNWKIKTFLPDRIDIRIVKNDWVICNIANVRVRKEDFVLVATFRPANDVSCFITKTVAVVIVDVAAVVVVVVVIVAVAAVVV